MGEGTLTLKRFNGDEVFHISKAEYYVFREDNYTEFMLEFETDETPLMTLPDTEDLPAHPNGEIAVILDADSDLRLAGSSFFIGAFSGEEEHWSRIYYLEHQDLENNEVEFLEQEGDQYHIHWRAETCDVNYYDGSKPPTKVVIDAWFSKFQK